MPATNSMSSGDYPVIDLQNLPPPKKPEGVQPGTRLFLSDNQELIPYCLLYLSHRLGNGDPVAGGRLPPYPSSVLTSSAHVHDQIQAVARVALLEKTDCARTLKQISTRPLQLMHRETLELIRPHLQPERHTIVEVASLSGVSDELRNCFSLLDLMARERGAYLTLAASANPRCGSALLDTPLGVVRVNELEPDPDARAAWAFCHTDLDCRSAIDYGRETVQLKHMRKGSGLKFERTTFIAKKLIDRVIVLCRSSGLSMSEIGGVVGLNKSNVSRALSGTTLLPREKIPDEWWVPFEETYSFGPAVIKKMKTVLG